MNSKPRVSVIIIFFNPGSFIQEAIESVLAQTYNDWELLLVDDGSTDESTVIATRYAQQYPHKLRHLEHPRHQNWGMSASRNLGIKNAEGEYLTFLDADDVWLSNTLTEQVQILDSHPTAAMVYGAIQWWYSWTGNPEDAERDFVHDPGVRPNTLIHPPKLLSLWLQNKAAVPSGIMVRRTSIERIGGFEETFRGLYEDQVFCAKVCLEAPVFASGQCWYRYRQHPGSWCSLEKASGAYYSARPIFLRWLADYLSQKEAHGTEIWKVLQDELWPYRHPILHRVFRVGRPLAGQIKRHLMLMARRRLLAPIRRHLHPGR